MLKSGAAASEVLRDLKQSPSSYSATADKLMELSPRESERAVKVAVLATYTADPLGPYLVVEGARRSLEVTPEFLPYGQLETQLLNKDSKLYRTDPDVIVILTRLEDIAARILEVSATGGDVSSLVTDLQERMAIILEEARRQSTAKVLISSFSVTHLPLAGVADAMLPLSQDGLVAHLNTLLAEHCRKMPGCFILDINGLMAQVGKEQWFDDKLYHLGRIALSATAQARTGAAIARLIATLEYPAKKCLALDADNTIWGGVVGEDGLGGIALSDLYPGNVFKAFQRYVLNLRSRGVILALISKNNPEDVEEVFDKHEDCLLKSDHFVAQRVNWSDKASNLREIADELSIDLDSFVFFDDNPAEREWVRSNLPEVSVVEVPKDPMRYIESLERLEAFGLPVLSDEDRMRSAMYLSETKRRKARIRSSSYDEFLESLEMKARIASIGPDNMGRVIQLLGKTNQFNLTTRRYSEVDLQRLLEEGTTGLTMRLEDCFGDNGLIGVAIAKPCIGSNGRSIVESFLLSCRVIGRGVEDLLLAVLSERVVEAGRGGEIKLMGEFVPTAKNRMVSSFYADHGFAPVPRQKHLWIRNISEHPLQRPPHISIELDI